MIFQTPLWGVVDVTALPEDLVEHLAATGALVVGETHHAGAYRLTQDPDLLGIRATPTFVPRIVATAAALVAAASAGGLISYLFDTLPAAVAMA